MVDHRSRTRAPDRSARDRKPLGGLIAEELEGVAALDEADALSDQALKLDRLDLGAVLLGVAAALRLLVGLELALDAVDLKAARWLADRPAAMGKSGIANKIVSRLPSLRIAAAPEGCNPSPPPAGDRCEGRDGRG